MYFEALLLTSIATAMTTTTQPTPYDSPIPSKPPKHVSFLHMTDVHVSETRPYSALNLKEFCKMQFPRLVAQGDVLFLAITGDLTDGIGSFWRVDSFGQQGGDWSLFREAISDCIATGVPVFKIRGNHDCFGVESYHGHSNAGFRQAQKHGVSKLTKDHPRLVLDSESGSYAFWDPVRAKSRFVFLENHRILPGPHQYYGEFSERQANWLEAFIKGDSDKESDTTYVFSHYPLATLTPESKKRLVDILDRSKSHVVYLSGHIHSVVGKRGVQALSSSHSENIHELQLSDYKWSGIVRKIDVSTGLFVDIPTAPGDTSSPATILFDPSTPHKTLLTVYSLDPIRYAAPCSNTSLHLPKLDDFNNMHIYETSPDAPIDCFKIVPRDHSGIHLHPVDTRLHPNSIPRLLFEYWFELFQLIILVIYLGIVYFAKQLYENDLSLIAFYLVLSPLIPNILSEHLFSRKWMIANSFGMLDLTSGEWVFETDSTRLVVMMSLYLIAAAYLNQRIRGPRSILTHVLWLLILAPFVFIDLRFQIGRGGFRSLIFSPHTWFMVLVIRKLVGKQKNL